MKYIVYNEYDARKASQTFDVMCIGKRVPPESMTPLTHPHGKMIAFLVNPALEATLTDDEKLQLKTKSQVKALGFTPPFFGYLHK